MSLKDFKDDLSRMATGMTRDEAHAKGICIVCKKPPTFYSDAGRREYQITGYCEPCWDKLMAEIEE